MTYYLLILTPNTPPQTPHPTPHPTLTTTGPNSQTRRPAIPARQGRLKIPQGAFSPAKVHPRPNLPGLLRQHEFEEQPLHELRFTRRGEDSIGRLGESARGTSWEGCCEFHREARPVHLRV